MYDPTIGQFISEDPIEFEAGDRNLRRYVGNSPTNATDPSGLEEFGLPPWKEMPSYDPGAGMFDFNAGNNAGNPTFRRWIREDPEKAATFVQGIVNRYRWHVRAASQHYGVPEALIYGTIIPEMINFGYADYCDLGSSTGPGQLTPAIVDFYNGRRFLRRGTRPATWSENDFVDSYRAVGALTRVADLTNQTRRSPMLDQDAFIDIFSKAAILDKQLQELELAAKGGGKLSVGNGKVITVPAMSPAFKKWAGGIKDGNALSQGSRKTNPAGLNDFFGNGLAALIAVLISMNRNNPGATGNAQGLHQYAGTQGIQGPQAQIGFSLFRDGYFRCDPTGSFEFGKKK